MMRRPVSLMTNLSGDSFHISSLLRITVCPSTRTFPLTVPYTMQLSESVGCITLSDDSKIRAQLEALDLPRMTPPHI